MPEQSWSPRHGGRHMYKTVQKYTFTGDKKVNKRYPKVWVGYHITLFNCFVTVVGWSGIFIWHLFSQASCKGKKSRLISGELLAELWCGKDNSNASWGMLATEAAFPVQGAGTKPSIKLGTSLGFVPSQQWHLATHYHTMPKFLHMLNRQKVSSREG